MPSTLTPTPVAVIVGASSGIGEALARRLAREGYRLALVARRGDRLDRLCAEINAGGEARAYVHDVRAYAEAATVMQDILRDFGRVDALVYNAGTQSAVRLDEYDFDKDRPMIEVNLLGALAWLNPAALLFERQGSGQIVGVGSVAGDRGRVGAPAYNAGKAGLATYLEALRNRLSRRGVNVLTVKPGMVATEMLKNAPRVMWVISPEQAADDIWRAMRARRQTLYTPARWGLLMLIIRHIPSVIFRRLKF